MDGPVKNSSGQMQLQRNRQLNEQLIHELNDKKMLAEIIREVTKCDKTLTCIVKCANLGTKVEGGSPKSPDSGSQQFTQSKTL